MDIPTNWSYVRVGDYVKTVTDFVASGSFASLRQNVKYYKEPNYAVMVRTCDFKTDFSESLVYTDKHGYEFLSNSNLFGGELLLSNIGASIGKVFIVPKLELRMTLAPNSIMVKFFDDTMRNYFYYLFLSTYGQNKLKEISVSSAQAKFNKTDFKQLLIPIPPLNEQLRIEKAIKEIENQINSIQKEYKNINELVTLAKTKVLDEIFGDNSSYKSYYKNRLKTTLSNLVPKDKIGDGDWVLSENMDINGEYSLLQLKHIGYGVYLDKSYCHVNRNFYLSNNCTEIKENYILINRLIADNMNVCLLPHLDFKCITAVDVCWIAPSKEYNQKYLMYYLLSPAFQKQVHLRTSGTTRKRISKKNLINLEILVHDLKYQEIIASEIEEMFKILDSIIS